MPEIDGDAIRSALAGTSIVVDVRARTASTNDDAKAAAAGGQPGALVVVADAQEAGRGRSGHRWHSPPGQNLYLSLLRRPSAAMTPASSGPLTLVVGLAVARVVRHYAALAQRVAVKWPNDIWLDGKKVAGILVEGQVRAARFSSVVIGVGINVARQPFPNELEGLAIALDDRTLAETSRERLCADVVRAINDDFDRFERDGFQAFVEAWHEVDALRGSDVEVIQPDEATVVGRAAGVADDGALLLATGPTMSEIQRITTGRVRLRS